MRSRTDRPAPRAGEAPARPPTRTPRSTPARAPRTPARWLRATLGAGDRPAAAARHGSRRRRRHHGCGSAASTTAWSPEGYRLRGRPSTGVAIDGGSAAGRLLGRADAAAAARPRRLPPRAGRAPDGTVGRAAGAHRGRAPLRAGAACMLDVARHFMPKDGVLRYLDLLAAHKLNVFHLHLTDDQGWRVEIKRYPRLTEVGAWRAPHQMRPPRTRALWDETPARRLLHPGRHPRDRRLRRRAAYHRRPRDRHPRPLAGRHRRLPGTRQHRRHRHHLPRRLGHLGRQPERTRPH